MKLLMSVYFSSFLSLSVLPQAQVVQLFILLILFHFEVPSFWIISWHCFLRIKNTLTWINEGECWAVDHLEINSVFCWDNKWNKSFKIESLSLVKNISTTFGPCEVMLTHSSALLCCILYRSSTVWGSRGQRPPPDLRKLGSLSNSGLWWEHKPGVSTSCWHLAMLANNTEYDLSTYRLILWFPVISWVQRKAQHGGTCTGIHTSFQSNVNQLLSFILWILDVGAFK